MGHYIFLHLYFYRQAVEVRDNVRRTKIVMYSDLHVTETGKDVCSECTTVAVNIPLVFACQSRIDIEQPTVTVHLWSCARDLTVR